MTKIKNDQIILLLKKVANLLALKALIYYIYVKIFCHEKGMNSASPICQSMIIPSLCALCFAVSIILTNKATVKTTEFN